VLTPINVLDREKQLGLVRELTDIVAAAGGDPTLADRTWVLITESPEGGWGINWARQYRRRHRGRRPSRPGRDRCREVCR
jgi:phenylpyruvate tautomerase PptA (4-oxalocrotonate tautomerase family)